MANSSTVTAGSDATAAQYNNLRKDLVALSTNVATTTGSANAYLLGVDAQMSALVAGMVIIFKTNFANTGAATINLTPSGGSALGAVSLKKSFNVALESGDLPNGMYVVAIYDGTNFQIVHIGTDMTSANKATLTGGTNADALHTHAYTKIVDNFTTAVAIASTTTETTVLSMTIPGGSLGTKGKLEFEIDISAFRLNSGSSTNGVIRMKYGATTLATITLNGSAVTAKTGMLRGYIVTAGATNAQEGCMQILLDPSDTTFGGATGAHSRGTSAIDSTADATFAITCQFSNSHANANATFETGVVKTTYKA